MANHEFGSMAIRRAKLPPEMRAGYRVYSDAEHFVTVEAATAADAMEMSKIANPVKIERMQFNKANVAEGVTNENAAAAAPEPVAAEPETAVETPVEIPAENMAEEAPAEVPAAAEAPKEA